MSKPLKAGVRAMFDFDSTTMKAFEQDKDVKSFVFGGNSYREMQITLFKTLSDACGEEILAHMAISHIDHISNKHVIVDIGKTVEAQVLVEHFSYDNVALLQIKREGCVFGKDIREYIDIRTRYMDILNNAYDLELFEAQIRKVLKKWELLDGDN